MKNLLIALFVMIVSMAYARTTLALETMAGDACNSAQTGWVRFSGGPEQDPPQQIRCNGSYWVAVSASGGLLDRITSNTTSVVVSGSTAFVNLYQNGGRTGWFDPATGLVTLGVSATGTISGTNGYIKDGLSIGTTITEAGVKLLISSTQANSDIVRVRSSTGQPLIEMSETTGNGGFMDIFDNFGTVQARLMAVNLPSYLLKSSFGLGTTAPSSTLHIVGAASTAGGLTLSTTDLATRLQIYGSGIASSNIDVNSGGGLYFRSSSTGNMVLFHAPSRRVMIGAGIGSSAPSATLHVNGTGVFTDNVGIGLLNPTTQLDVSGSIQYTGSIADISDRRLKTAIRPWRGSALEKMALMKPITFEMKNNRGVTEYGFIAQDVQPVFPELVMIANDASKTLSMNYVGMVAPMVKAIQELKERNDTLAKDNAEMKRQLSALCKATKACQ